MKAWVASITIELLGIIEDMSVDKSSRLQVWATLFEKTGDNAMYIHRENPNNSLFAVANKGADRQASHFQAKGRRLGVV